MDAIAATSLCPLAQPSKPLVPSSLHCWATRFRLSYGTLAPSRRKGSSQKCSTERVRCGHVPESSQWDTPPLQRREAISQALLAVVLSTLPLPAQGVTEVDAGAEFKLYEDPGDKFSLLVPQKWSRGEGRASGQRKVTAFFPSNDSFTNVNVVITGLGADYTGLGSFGTPEMFAENLVNSLDRSWQKPPGQAAKLIDSRSRGGMYYIEYTLQRPGEKKFRLLSAVGIGFNDWYNRLFTVTGQFWEEDADKYRTSIDKVISSFKLT